MVYLALLISVGASYYFIKLLFKIDKYEFENRSTGGVIGFPDYKTAFWHTRKKALVRVGAIICMLGSMFLFLGILFLNKVV